MSRGMNQSSISLVPPEAQSVSVPWSVDYRAIYDLIITACEGGVGYWVSGYRNVYLPPGCDASWLHGESDGGDLTQDGAPVYPRYAAPLCGGYTEFLAEDPDTGEHRPYRLDLGAIERGLKLMAEHHPQQFAAGVTQSGDAITGDIFMQCCLLGECAYG